MNQLIDQMHEQGKDKYEDADFVPSTDILFKSHDIVSEEEAKTMQGLQWLRPKEISMKSAIVGFTQLNKK